MLPRSWRSSLQTNVETLDLDDDELIKKLSIARVQGRTHLRAPVFDQSPKEVMGYARFHLVVVSQFSIKTGLSPIEILCTNTSILFRSII